jgi:RND superfamily putative drug exporter
MQYYISSSVKGIIFEIVLDKQPYNTISLDRINEVKSSIENTLKRSYLEGSEFYVGGTSSTMSDVRNVTNRDFILVAFFILVGIFIVLIVLVRSILVPLYLLATILLSYLTTMGVTYFVFVFILKQGISWTVPFFSFCLLVALGIDYNIFFVTSVKQEYVAGDMKGTVERALGRTGGIITSCGIIMAGTFGALMATPIRTMIEIGFTTVIGILMDTFVIRSFLVPALMVKFGEMNWWPGRRIKVTSVDR